MGLDAQDTLDFFTVGEGDPAAVQIHVAQLQDQIFHDVACVQVGQVVLLGHQDHILRRAHQELAVAGGPFQSGPGVGTEDVQLGLQFRNQAANGIIIVVFQHFQLCEGNLLIGEFPNGLSVLDQSFIIHKVASS